jgi:hypothetical protein
MYSILEDGPVLTFTFSQNLWNHSSFMKMHDGHIHHCYKGEGIQASWRCAHDGNALKLLKMVWEYMDKEGCKSHVDKLPLSIVHAIFIF